MPSSRSISRRRSASSTNDLGNVEAPVVESLAIDDKKARFLPQILALCDRVAKLVEQARLRGETPLVVGGDHSVALGSLVGMAQAHGPGGVIWVDAHGDLNTPETSPSGNVHGMVLAAALDLAGAASTTTTGRCPRSSRESSRSSACGRSTRASATC